MREGYFQRLPPLPLGNDYLLLDLPETDYRKVHKLQTEIVRVKKSGLLKKGVIILVEHPPVITLGRRGGLENLLVSQNYLEDKGITIQQVERGGTITCHGPGQLVVYPIVHLHSSGFRVPEFVFALEEIMLRTVADLGLQAERRKINNGIFVGERKLGSVGIALRRGITFHGLALNIGPLPEFFSWINPCGLEGVQTTSIAEELGRDIAMQSTRAILKKHLEAIFGIKLLEENLENFKRNLPKTPARQSPSSVYSKESGRKIGKERL